MQTYDLLVIGSGPAGQRAAVQAAKLGKKVAIFDSRSTIGGVSVHTGTIPSKTVREAVLYLSGWRQRGFYGRGYKLKDQVSAADVTDRVDITLKHQVDVMQHQLSRNGVMVINGRAQFESANTLLVTDDQGETTLYTGKCILIAVGTKTHRPAHIPFNGTTVVDSDEILQIAKLPRNMAVIGGGVIGIEYASILSTLDIETTLIESRSSMLEFVDKEIIDEFQHHLRDRGVTLRMSEDVASIKHLDNGKVLTQLKSGKRLCTELVLFAAGRAGATDNLGLDKAGLQADKRGRLNVNEHYQTSVKHIYAAGDVIGFPSLAATSMEQGRLAACHMFGKPSHAQPEYFPYGIYAVPEISMVGKTEEQLQAEGIAYESGVARIRETARGQIIGLREGVLKMLFSIEDKRLLGVHIVGEGATELIHIGQAVLALGGKLDYFVETAFNYPTLAEAYKVAALNAWNRISAYETTNNTKTATEKTPTTPLSAVK